MPIALRVALILAIGVVIGAFFLWTAPTTEPEEKDRGAKIVQTIEVQPRTELISVTAFGPVVPARKVTIKPEVGGRVIQYNDALVPGGFITEGQEILRIDPSDYQLAVTEQESALEEARFELEVEKGRQVVALREWGLLEQDLTNSEVNRSLVLREPHLRRTEAMLRKATNEIALAELQLSRTSLIAPFNAMVVDEAVELGQLIEAGNDIATLVGTDEFWVQAALPLGELKHIRLPGPDQTGATAKVFLDTGNGEPVSWTGRVVRLLSDLEPTGRMARVLVRVRDPLGLDSAPEKMPLLLGSYVRVEIEAGELQDVLVIPRAALREGDRIWVVNQHKELQIREVEILWTRQDNVLVGNAMKPGERLIVSGLRTALPGMKVDPQPAAGPSISQEPVGPLDVTTAP
jgi:RND family efflux transporter MFP subunit